MLEALTKESLRTLAFGLCLLCCVLLPRGRTLEGSVEASLIEIKNKDGKAVIRLSVSSAGAGEISVFSAQGDPRLRLRCGDGQEAGVEVLSQGGATVLSAGCDIAGNGFVVMRDREGRELSRLDAVKVNESDILTGSLTIRLPTGGTACSLFCDESQGGLLALMDATGEGRTFSGRTKIR